MERSLIICSLTSARSRQRVCCVGFSSRARRLRQGRCRPVWRDRRAAARAHTGRPAMSDLRACCMAIQPQHLWCTAQTLNRKRETMWTGPIKCHTKKNRPLSFEVPFGRPTRTEIERKVVLITRQDIITTRATLIKPSRDLSFGI